MNGGWLAPACCPGAGRLHAEGAHLPLAGLLLVLPALEPTGLLVAFESVFGRLRNEFWMLQSLLLTMLFLALLRDPRAEGATDPLRRPGPGAGLDRAPGGQDDPPETQGARRPPARR